VEQGAAQGNLGVSWGAEQLRILRELGHEPMLLASRAPEATTAAATAGRDSQVVREQPSRAHAAPAEQLAAAIVRAAGGRDLSALALDFERLRREPSLKRALWPRLRALRRAP
jgi:hypothetical protein